MTTTAKVLLVLFAVAVIAGGAAAVFVLTRASGPMRVANVDEVARDRARFEGRVMRLRGTTVSAIERRQEPTCHYRFRLGHHGAEIPVVVSACVAPDLFREGAGTDVTAEGRLAGESFEATGVFVVPSPSH
jgi:cytochrome c-type biogenesis protein CcmE